MNSAVASLAACEPPSPPARPGEEQLASMAKALGHPARIHIVALLLERQSCIGRDIVDALGLAQSTVSEHLRILSAAGIVSGQVKRPWVRYSLEPRRLRPLAALLRAVLDSGRCNGHARSARCPATASTHPGSSPP